MSEKFSFVTTEYSVAADIPRPLSFVFVSDLHGCPNEGLIERIKTLAPDAILVGGDFVHNEAVWRSGIEFLRLASKVAPTFVSLGNHELKAGFDVRPLVLESGTILLDNASARFEGVSIGGLSSVSYIPNAVPDLRFLERFASNDGFKLLLCHHPEYYGRYIKGLDIDLTLSGHAHGGQWRFFGRGTYAPGQGLFPKYTSGLYDGARLLVGRGLGNTVIFPRIFNKPELIVIRLG